MRTLAAPQQPLFSQVYSDKPIDRRHPRRVSFQHFMEI
ncbi:hypothetical protein SSAG_04308 [Streptomyces sp. Mg1]|nr:hypothetical protein SSAG_04308 [Streptomyces sp. Mg1]